ncbi:MAG: hypothetical protein R3C49_04620 [Planctomycetaceae bacterium]
MSVEAIRCIEQFPASSLRPAVANSLELSRLRLLSEVQCFTCRAEHGVDSLVGRRPRNDIAAWILLRRTWNSTDWNRMLEIVNIIFDHFQEGSAD